MLGTLSTEGQLLIFEGITFATLVFVLRRFAWKPLREALDAREQRIQADVRAAEEARRGAEKLKDEYSRQLANVEKTTEEIIGRVGNEALRLRKEMAETAKAETSRLFEKTRREIESAEKDLIRRLRVGLTDASLTLTERLIRAAMNERTQKKLMDEAIEGFEAYMTK